MTSTNKKPVEIRDEFLKCVQCTEKFKGEDKTPRVLQCLHMVCSPCLTTLIKGKRAKCPECQHKIEKSEKDIPIDYTKEDLLDFERSFRDATEKKCYMCDKKADIRCYDCKLFYCNECSCKIHTNLKTHKIFRLPDVTRPDEFTYMMTCPEEGHGIYPLQYYCETCKMSLCSECRVKEHLKKEHHDIKDLSSKFEETTKILTDKKDSIIDTLYDIKDLQGNIVQVQKHLRRESAAAERQVTFYFNMCIQLLEKRKQSLLHEIDEKYKENWKILIDQGAELDKVKRKITHSVKFLDHSILSQNKVGFLKVASFIDERFQEMAKFKYDRVPRVKGDIEFSTKNQALFPTEKFMDMIPVHGVISSPMVFHPKCEITTIPVECKDDEKKIKVCLNDHLGEIVVDDTMTIAGVFKDKITRKEHKSAFVRDKPGVYTSVQVVKNAEDLDINIMINGNFLENFRAFGKEGDPSRTTAENEWKLAEVLSCTKATRSVMIDCICESDTTKDDIEAYFNNQEYSGGKDVTRLDINTIEGSCTVSFTEPEVVNNVLNRNHKIRGHDIIVRPLHQAPNPLFIYIDLQKLSFILKYDDTKHDLEDALQGLYAKVDWNKSKSNLYIYCTLKDDVPEYQRKVKYWPVIVTQRVLEFSEMVSVMTFKWDAVRPTIDEVLPLLENSKVDTVVNGSSVTIVGYKVQFEDTASKLRVKMSGEQHPIIHIKEGAISSTTRVRHLTQKLRKERCIFLQTETVQNKLSDSLSAKNIICALEFGNDEFVDLYTPLGNEIREEGCIHRIIENITTFKYVNIMGRVTEEFKKEVKDIKAKTGGSIHIQTDNDKIAVCTTMKSTASVITKHLNIMLQNSEGPGGLRCKAHFLFKTKHTISVLHGDITKLESDTIVCSSDKYLKLGIGVGKRLVEKGGQIVQDECARYLQKLPKNELAEWEIFCGTAGNLCYKKIIHIPGKKWQERSTSTVLEKDRKIYSYLVQKSLVTANELGYKSVALPALCCGNNEYPVDKGTMWMVDAINTFLQNFCFESSIKRIFLCDMNREAVEKFVETLRKGKMFNEVFPKGCKDITVV